MTIQNRAKSYEKAPVDERDGEDLPTINLSDLLRVLRTRKKTIALTTALVLAITSMVVSQLTPRYTATAYVMLDQRQNNVANAGAVVSALPTDQTSVANQVQILQSRNLSARVVDKLKLVDDPEFGTPPDDPPLLPEWLNPTSWFKTATVDQPPPTAAQKREATINRVLRNVSAAAQGLSSAIAIKFVSVDADKSALIANAIAQAYVEDQLNAKKEATKSASQWLTERLEQISLQTQASERAVEQYKAANDLTDTTNGANGLSITQQQLSALNAQLIVAQGELAQQEARFTQVAAMKKSGHSADVSLVVASPLISQLRQTEAELLRQEAELSSKYGPLHPKLLDLQSQKGNLEAKIDQEVSRIVETIGNDVEVARARVRSLENSLAQLTAQSRKENLARVKLGELSSSATSNRALFEALLTQFKEIDGRDGIQAPDARVISAATVPGSPSFPNKTLFLGAALPGGLLLGFLLAMISDSLEAGFRSRDQVERALSLPLLSAFPEIPSSKKGEAAADRVIRNPMSSFAEAVRGLEMGLALCRQGKPPKIVVVTSSVPSEGKTTVAVSLARLAARNGQRVILFDGDVRQSRVAKMVNLSSWQHGTSDALRGGTALVDCLHKDPLSDVMIMPSRPIANPSDVLSSKAMSSLIRVLSENCDLLIIDSPPLLAVNDARILGQFADAVVLAVRWERTPRQAAIHALRSLGDSGVPIAGVVLTRTNEREYQYYGSALNKYYRG